MTPITRVLDKLEGVEERSGGWQALCPAHDDREPSLSITRGDDGRVLLTCHAGCDVEDVVSGLGLEMRDLFSKDARGEGGTPYPHKTPATVQPHPESSDGKPGSGLQGPVQPDATAQPCTLEDYAQAKGLPVGFLKGLGLMDFHYTGAPAVRIPYRNPDGSEAAMRFRTALEKTEGGPDRFKWRNGSKAMLYGLECLERIRAAGRVVLVEGESDAQTLWLHNIEALGVPGAGNWKPGWSEHLEGVGKVFAVIEPDRGGETFRDKLRASGVGDRLHFVDLGEHKDPSALYLDDPARFRENFAAAMENAVPYAELRRAEDEAASRRAWAMCQGLAESPDILERFAHELARLGVAGEVNVAKLIYLSLVSRLLQKPVSLAIKGPSSGGKSHVTEQVLRFVPDDAYYSLTAMSERALAYSEEPLSHRFLVIFEAAGMSGDFATYLMRSLLSEGRIRYEVVEKTAEGLKPRLIEREGPTGLLVTTTATRLHPENETRMISATVTDTAAQTKSVLAALADEAEVEPPDLAEWHALQTWLEGGERRVTVPYAPTLANEIPPVAVRLRRDFGAILNLVRAHAILHRAGRKRNAKGQIIATVEDYASVRALVKDLVSEGIEATVPATVRETVDVLSDLYGADREPVTIVTLARELELDKSAAWRRVRSAMDRGYVRNLEDKKGRPARLVPGDDLPDDIEILPDPDKLTGCTVAGVSGGIHHPLPPSNGSTHDHSGGEGFPYPSEEGATVQTPEGDRRERLIL